VSEVRDNPQRSRYEIVVDGDLVGVAEYTLRGNVITFTHTWVAPERRDDGYASELVGSALDDVRSRGLSVVARCPYVAKFIRNHADYADLLTV
jgi:predicted GNAT family acetyltransferase